MATAKKAAAKTSARKRTAAIRDTLSVEEAIEVKAERAEEGKGKEVTVTTLGGDMFDPVHAQWIYGERKNLVSLSTWVRDQLASGKLKEVK